MLTSRDEQLRVLAAAALASGVQASMRKLFPEHCAALGVAGAAQTVNESIARARGMALPDAELEPWVALEFAFGPEFYKRPEYAWAQAILSDGSVKTPAARIADLRASALRYLAQLETEEKTSGTRAKAAAIG